MNTEYRYHIEIPGIYDGVSVHVTHDGKFVNRWKKEDGARYVATEKWIADRKREEKEAYEHPAF